MKIKHTCQSGNSCDIRIPVKIRPGAYNDVSVEWDSYPPSAADLIEYHEEVYPNRVLPLLESAIRKSNGPGRMVEIMPGLRAWMAAKSEEEN